MFASVLVLSDAHLSFRHTDSRDSLPCRLPALIKSRYDIRVPYPDEQRAFAGNRDLGLTA